MDEIKVESFSNLTNEKLAKQPKDIDDPIFKKSKQALAKAISADEDDIAKGVIFK